MARMGKYCKAYPLSKLREYVGWNENLQNARKEKQKVGDKELDIVRELIDDDFLYVQENYTVTDGIFIDENIIFDDVTSEWKKYCNEKLKFAIPVYEPIKIKNTEKKEK